jgi:hypothetical protein
LLAVEASFAAGAFAPIRYAMLWSGVVAFTFAYIDSIFLAAQSERSSDKSLYIPVAGPWIALGRRDCTSPRCTNEALAVTHRRRSVPPATVSAR